MMPAVSNRFLANVARAVDWARRAERGEEDDRSSAGRSAARSARPRWRSNGSLARCRTSGSKEPGPSLTIDARSGAGGGRRRLGDVGELAQAGERLAAGGDRVARGRERASSSASCTRPASTAATMPPAASIRCSSRPRLGRQLVGEVLDVPRAAGRVDDAGQVALQLQHGLGVAGDPSTERRAAFRDEGVVGQDGDGVGAAHARGEARHGRAQGVHPRVVAGHHHARAVGVVERRARPPAGGRRSRRPAPTRGARRGTWRSSRTGRRSRPSGTRAGGSPGRGVPRPRRGRARCAPRRRRSRPVSCASVAPASCHTVPSATTTLACGARPGQLADEGGCIGQGGVEVGGAAGAHPGADGVDAERAAPLVGRDPRGVPAVRQARAAVRPTSSAGVDSDTGASSRNTPSSALRDRRRIDIGGEFDQDAGRSALPARRRALDPSTAGHTR